MYVKITFSSRLHCSLYFTSVKILLIPKIVKFRKYFLFFYFLISFVEAYIWNKHWNIQFNVHVSIFSGIFFNVLWLSITSIHCNLVYLIYSWRLNWHTETYSNQSCKIINEIVLPVYQHFGILTVVNFLTHGVICLRKNFSNMKRGKLSWILENKFLISYFKQIMSGNIMGEKIISKYGIEKIQPKTFRN